MESNLSKVQAWQKIKNLLYIYGAPFFESRYLVLKYKYLVNNRDVSFIIKLLLIPLVRNINLTFASFILLCLPSVSSLHIRFLENNSHSSKLLFSLLFSNSSCLYYCSLFSSYISATMEFEVDRGQITKILMNLL